MAAPYVYFGAVVALGNSLVDSSDDTVEFTLEAERDVPEVEVYGPSQVRSATGSLKWSGQIRVVYDYLGGANKAYRLLQTELLTPTSGGYKCIFKPTGEGAGEEEILAYINLSGMNQPDAGGSDIQTRTFPFKVNGQPTIASQTT